MELLRIVICECVEGVLQLRNLDLAMRPFKQVRVYTSGYRLSVADKELHMYRIWRRSSIASGCVVQSHFHFGFSLTLISRVGFGGLNLCMQLQATSYSCSVHAIILDKLYNNDIYNANIIIT